MFDIGFWEIGLIAIVALLVVGPERLPELLRQAGRWMGQIQRLARELRWELERETGMVEYNALTKDVTAADVNALLKIDKQLPGEPKDENEQEDAQENEQDKDKDGEDT